MSAHIHSTISAEIVLHPGPEIFVEYDSSLTLTCVGYGSTRPNVTWFKDGVMITNSSTIEGTIFETIVDLGSTGFTLSILELCPLAIGGNYTCAVHNTQAVHFQVIITDGTYILS